MLIFLAVNDYKIIPVAMVTDIKLSLVPLTLRHAQGERNKSQLGSE